MKNIFLVVLSVLSVSSCSDKDPDPKPKNRTVLTYMVADNNLYSYGLKDINEMELGWSPSYDGNMVVFFYPVDVDGAETPKLLLIRQDDNANVIKSKVLKEYSRSVDPCDPATLRGVLEDVMKLTPADNYSLIMWSHGTGWLPVSFTNNSADQRPVSGSKLYASEEGISTYTIGSTYTFKTEMEIDRMEAEGFPSGMAFDMISFDACYMGGIEVAFQFRNRTKYFVGSASETPAMGFAYNLIMPALMARDIDVRALARITYEDCLSKTIGWQRTCTIGAIDCSKLEELAASVHQLMADHPRSATDIPSGGSVQDFGVGFRSYFYDLADYTAKLWPGVSLDRFRQALQTAVIASYYYPWMMDAYPVTTFCGLSAYIPQGNHTAKVGAAYHRYDWPQASGLSVLVP